MTFIIIQLVLLNTNMYESPLSSLDILFFTHLALVRISSLEFSTTNSIVVPSLRLEEDNGIPADELVQCSLFATKRRWLYFINLRGPKAYGVLVPSLQKGICVFLTWKRRGLPLAPPRISLFVQKLLPRTAMGPSHEHILATSPHCQNIWSEKCI